MKPISELSRQELLGLIYNNFGDTLTTVHPCVCACCDTHPNFEKVVVEDRMVNPYYYICDKCEELL